MGKIQFPNDYVSQGDYRKDILVLTGTEDLPQSINKSHHNRVLVTDKDLIETLQHRHAVPTHLIETFRNKYKEDPNFKSVFEPVLTQMETADENHDGWLTLPEATKAHQEGVNDLNGVELIYLGMKSMEFFMAGEFDPQNENHISLLKVALKYYLQEAQADNPDRVNSEKFTLAGLEIINPTPGERYDVFEVIDQLKIPSHLSVEQRAELAALIYSTQIRREGETLHISRASHGYSALTQTQLTRVKKDLETLLRGEDLPPETSIPSRYVNKDSSNSSIKKCMDRRQKELGEAYRPKSRQYDSLLDMAKKVGDQLENYHIECGDYISMTHVLYYIDKNRNKNYKGDFALTLFDRKNLFAMIESGEKELVEIAKLECGTQGNQLARDICSQLVSDGEEMINSPGQTAAFLALIIAGFVALGKVGERHLRNRLIYMNCDPGRMDEIISEYREFQEENLLNKLLMGKWDKYLVTVFIIGSAMNRGTDAGKKWQMAELSLLAVMGASHAGMFVDQFLETSPLVEQACFSEYPAQSLPEYAPVGENGEVRAEKPQVEPAPEIPGPYRPVSGEIRPHDRPGIQDEGAAREVESMATLGTAAHGVATSASLSSVGHLATAGAGESGLLSLAYSPVSSSPGSSQLGLGGSTLNGTTDMSKAVSGTGEVVGGAFSHAGLAGLSGVMGLRALDWLYGFDMNDREKVVARIILSQVSEIDQSMSGQFLAAVNQFTLSNYTAKLIIKEFPQFIYRVEKALTEESLRADDFFRKDVPNMMKGKIPYEGKLISANSDDGYKALMVFLSDEDIERDSQTIELINRKDNLRAIYSIIAGQYRPENLDFKELGFSSYEEMLKVHEVGVRILFRRFGQALALENSRRMTRPWLKSVWKIREYFNEKGGISNPDHMRGFAQIIGLDIGKVDSYYDDYREDRVYRSFERKLDMGIKI